MILLSTKLDVSGTYLRQTTSLSDSDQYETAPEDQGGGVSLNAVPPLTPIKESEAFNEAENSDAQSSENQQDVLTVVKRKRRRNKKKASSITPMTPSSFARSVIKSPIKFCSANL
jgi:hypothetical protein